jgi:hypothetical protein
MVRLSFPNDFNQPFRHVAAQRRIRLPCLVKIASLNKLLNIRDAPRRHV